MSCHYNRFRAFGLPRGSVAIEFVIIAAFILPVLIFGIIDFGRLINARQIVSEVSRVGGGLVFWRADEYGYIDIYGANSTKTENLFNLLEDAGSPIFDDNATKWKIIISKIDAAWQQGATPMIVAQVERGGLNVNSAIGEEGLPPNQDALPHIYSHLEFDTGNQAPDKSELGVVEVFYKYEPITPLPNFIEGILKMDGNGTIIRNCKAFF
ncbi:MAG: pilus assembly protein [Deltaproteobacteria bacterium]|nr:pilus assembly protein [Deltaproteobacteria bacterium]